jgi:hypothetical protein
MVTEANEFVDLVARPYLETPHKSRGVEDMNLRYTGSSRSLAIYLYNLYSELWNIESPAVGSCKLHVTGRGSSDVLS